MRPSLSFRLSEDRRRFRIFSSNSIKILGTFTRYCFYCCYCCCWIPALSASIQSTARNNHRLAFLKPTVITNTNRHLVPTTNAYCLLERNSPKDRFATMAKMSIPSDDVTTEKEIGVVSDETMTSPEVRRSTRKRSPTRTTATTEVVDEEKTRRKRTTKKAKQSPDSSNTSKAKVLPNEDRKGLNLELATESDTSKSPPKPKATKPPSHQVLTTRDMIPKLWNAEKAAQNGSYTFKIASWNVAGLRAILNKNPNALSELVQRHDLDVLCLQETKLQDSHVDDPKLKLRGHLLEDLGFDAFYSCSSAKKGYSGTATFVKRRSSANSTSSKKQMTIKNFFATAPETKNKIGKQPDTPENAMAVDAKSVTPENVSYSIDIVKHDQEGRMIIVDFPLFTLCNVYVPNSGQNLDRLKYRTEEWDKDFLSFMQQKGRDRGVPVMWLGDLNVAHTNLEVWNDGAKHLPKQAGVTPEERASFQQQLDSGFIDAFRRLHPTAGGHYSYWSTRAGNRPPNKGLRLDYFICHPSFFDENSKVIARDSYMDYSQEGSDHCPVILELEIKNK